MGLYDRAAATANRLLNKYGQLVTLTKKDSATYDPATGESILTDRVTYCVGAIFDGSFRAAGESNEPQTLVRRFIQKTIILNSIATPEIGDTVSVSDGFYSIVSIKKLAPSGITVMWECILQ